MKPQKNKRIIIFLEALPLIVCIIFMEKTHRLV